MATEFFTQAQLEQMGFSVVDVERELATYDPDTDRIVEHEPSCTCPARLHRKMDGDRLFHHMLEVHGTYLRNLDPEWRAEFYGDETWNGAYH